MVPHAAPSLYRYCKCPGGDCDHHPLGQTWGGGREGHSPGGARWACTARLAAMGTTWHLVLNRSPFAQVEHTTSVAGHLMEIHWPLPPLGSVDPCSHEGGALPPCQYD